MDQYTANVLIHLITSISFALVVIAAIAAVAYVALIAIREIRDYEMAKLTADHKTPTQ